MCLSINTAAETPSFNPTTSGLRLAGSLPNRKSKIIKNRESLYGVRLASHPKPGKESSLYLDPVYKVEA
jgi:hypothetical protein